NLEEQLAGCDIAISCTGAPHTVLKLETVQSVMSLRSEHPLVIIDIAVPPDVESGVKQVSNVFLYDIDELTKICGSNYNQRMDEIHTAAEVVDDELERFMSSWQELEVRPIIAALVEKAEGIRQAQLGLTLKKLPQLSEEELSHLEAMTKAIVNKMLREPIQCLKNGHSKREDYIRALSELFRLDGKKPK
ncbi:glutamyl-tRNA reductase, partial [Chloroflexota bacterium]